MRRKSFTDQEVDTLLFAAVQAIDGVAADVQQLEQLLAKDVGDLAVAFLQSNAGRFIEPGPANLLATAASAARVFEHEARDCLKRGELALAMVAALNAQRAISRAAGAALGLQLSADREVDEKEARAASARHMNDVKHQRSRAAAGAIPARWAALSAKGMTKSGAAKVIASEVNQAESTVRRKLQGLPDAR